MPESFLTQKQIEFIRSNVPIRNSKGGHYNFKSQLKKRIVDESPDFLHNSLTELTIAHDYLSNNHPESVLYTEGKIRDEHYTILSFLRAWLDKDELEKIVIELLAGNRESLNLPNLEFHEPGRVLESASEYLNDVHFEDCLLEDLKNGMVHGLKMDARVLEGRFIPILKPGILSKLNFADNEQKSIIEQHYGKMNDLLPDSFPQDGYSSHLRLVKIPDKWMTWLDWVTNDEDCFLKNGKERICIAWLILLFLGAGRSYVDSSDTGELVGALKKGGLIDERILSAQQIKLERILGKMNRRRITQKDGKGYRPTKDGVLFSSFVVSADSMMGV